MNFIPSINGNIKKVSKFCVLCLLNCNKKNQNKICELDLIVEQLQSDNKTQSTYLYSTHNETSQHKCQAEQIH